MLNFARLVKVPGMYCWGFNDGVCSVTSMYATYNVIPGTKSLSLALETGHWTFPEQTEKLNNWLVEKTESHSITIYGWATERTKNFSRKYSAG